MKKIKKLIILAIALVLTVVLAISGYNTYNDWKEKDKYNQIRDTLNSVSPKIPEDGNEQDAWIAQAKEQFQLTRETIGGGDACAWITVPGTQIDYPVMRASDNDYYLHRDIYGKYLYAGSLFMDWRCEPDFSLFPTVIYGHNMRSGAMFGELDEYRSQSFFDTYTYGWVIMSDKVYKLDFFAYSLVESTDEKIYIPDKVTGAQKQAFFTHLESNAMWYRDIGQNIDDRIVLLSTCAYDFLNARSVLVARMTEYN